MAGMWTRKMAGNLNSPFKNGPLEQTEEVSAAAAGHLARLAH
jgi:hypothetical protein